MTNDHWIIWLAVPVVINSTITGKMADPTSSNSSEESEISDRTQAAINKAVA